MMYGKEQYLTVEPHGLARGLVRKVLCQCDYCRSKELKDWQEGQLKCSSCGGTLSIISHFDDALSDEELYHLSEREALWNSKHCFQKHIFSFVSTLCILILLSPIIAPLLALVFNSLKSDVSMSNNNSYYESDNNYREDTVTYNLPDLDEKVFLVGDNTGAYKLTDKEDYKKNNKKGDYKKLVLDEDGNYYHKQTDMYVWLNNDITPPQFQYWLEGLSSRYGDYGWMEYDEDEDEWYIEVSSDNWQPLEDKLYKKFKKRLWHIDYIFTTIEGTE